MKIALITPVFPPYAAGMATVASAHADALVRAGHEVTVFAPLGKSGIKMTPRYHTVSLHSRLRFGNAAATPMLARISGFDRYVLEYPFVGGTEFLLRNPTVTADKLRVYYHMDLVGRGWMRPVFGLYTRWVLPRLVRKAAKIAVSSLDYAKTGLLARFITQDPAKFQEVPIGVFVGAGLVPARGGGQAPTLLFVGVLDRAHYFKGVDILLRALAGVPDARLTVVGDGDLRPTYERLASTLGIKDRVTFAGRVKNEDLTSYYDKSDALVLPSTDRSEAFGIVLLEAMAAGRAVVASDLPGVRTLVRENGLLVRPGDVSDLQEKIRDLLRDPDRLARMGASGRQMVEERYSAEKTGEEFVRWIVS